MHININTVKIVRHGLQRTGEIRETRTEITHLRRGVKLSHWLHSGQFWTHDGIVCSRIFNIVRYNSAKLANVQSGPNQLDTVSCSAEEEAASRECAGLDQKDFRIILLMMMLML